jgi:hypothetical protein
LLILDFTIAKSLKGSSGAIKDIRVIENSHVVLTCGYDRFLRIFNYKTYEELPQVYLKNKLNVIYPIAYECFIEKEEVEEDLGEDSEEMFDDDEIVEDEEEGGDDEDEEDDFENGSNQN